MRVRNAVREDISELARLCAQLGYPSSPNEVQERLEQLLAQRDHAVFVVDGGGRLLGWVHVHPVLRLESPACAEIGGLVVDAEFRRQGVGGALIDAAEEWAETAGLTLLRVRSNVARDEAHRFYVHHGFEEAKTQTVFRKELVSG